MDNLPSFALDCDDLLIKTGLGLIAYYNSTRGTNHKLEDFTHYRWEEFLNMNHDEWFDFEFKFYASDYHQSLEPNDGAKELIEMLRGKAHSHLVTARPIEGVSFLKVLLAKNFAPNDFKRIHMVKSLTVPSLNRTKLEECVTHNLTLLVDDYHKHVNLAALGGISGILLDSPWNKNVEVHPLVTRARNLYEVSEIIQKNYLK